jgi:hypothetical protein
MNKGFRHHRPDPTPGQQRVPGPRRRPALGGGSQGPASEAGGKLPEGAALVIVLEDRSLEDTLVAAFEEYGQNARCPHPDGRVKGPDGELVAIFDEDAGF